jgi:hypothetical protein
MFAAFAGTAARAASGGAEHVVIAHISWLQAGAALQEAVRVLDERERKLVEMHHGTASSSRRSASDSSYQAFISDEFPSRPTP